MKKTFITLAWVVGFVILAGWALNIIMPNVTKQGANAVETMLYKATGMQFDFNGDGIKGEAGNDGNMADGNTTTNDQEVSGGVEGFGNGSGGN